MAPRLFYRSSCSISAATGRIPKSQVGHSPVTRSYRFTLTVNVEPGHPAYDDPEWAADAARGSLTNDYGLRAIYTESHEVELDHDVDPALAAA